MGDFSGRICRRMLQLSCQRLVWSTAAKCRFGGLEIFFTTNIKNEVIYIMKESYYLKKITHQNAGSWFNVLDR
jgi:hypothetical protein